MNAITISIILFVLALSPCSAQNNIARPVVVIPGILGSRLCDSSGNVIWGNASSYRNLPKLDLTSTSNAARVEPCGLVDEVLVLPPFSIRYYKGLLDALKGFGYEENKTLFVFPYDWRKSAVETSEAFATFIEKNLRDQESFDVVAHSMGGYVVRYYLFKHGPEASIHKVIYLGTPFLGSAATLATLKDGFGFMQNAMAGGKTSVRQIVLSIPGFLELLPRDPECCYVKDGEQQIFFADRLFDAETWRRNGWLPAPHDQGKDFDIFASNLTRASQVAKAITANVVNKTRDLQEVRIIGDEHDTVFRIGMYRGKTTPQDWFIGMDQGDGTVSVWSASADKSYRYLGGTGTSFEHHTTLYDDDHVQHELRKELTWTIPKKEWPIGLKDRPAITLKREGVTHLWTLKRIGVRTSEPAIEVGKSIEIDVQIAFTEDTKPNKGWFTPIVSISCPDGVRIESIAETTSTAELDNRKLHYRARSAAIPTTGTCDISVKAGDNLTGRAYFAVLEPIR